MSIGVMLFCPFTGKPRHPSDIESDPKGILVWDGEEPLRAYTPPAQRKPLTDEQMAKALPRPWPEEGDRVCLSPTELRQFARAIEAKLRSKNEDRN